MTNFEYDIEYADRRWYPLKDEKLPNATISYFGRWARLLTLT
jgi:hypothetical protein